MGSKRGSHTARSQQIHSTSSRELAEVSVPGSIPRFEIPGWRERYGIAAGITAGVGSLSTALILVSGASNQWVR